MYQMKQLAAISAILLFLIPTLPAQTNNIVRGIVTLQNSNSQPAKNVQVTTFGANPAFTNSAGQFELRISGGKPGQTVRLIVQKDSFQVLGPDPLIFETAIREDPNEMIRIALANIQVFQERISRFMQSIDKQIQSQSAALRDLQAQQEEMAKMEARQKVIQDSIAMLFQQVQTLEASKEELAKKLASIDLDQASAYSIKAIETFLSGNAEEALALLNEEKLDAFYEEVLKREEEVARAKQQAIENYMIRARMQQTLLQFDEAAASYRAAIEKDSTNLLNLVEYGNYLASINRENEGIPVFQQALSQAKEPLYRLELLGAIGMIYVMQNRASEADSMLSAAFRLSKTLELPDANPLLNLMNSAGYMHQTNGDFQPAEKYYLDALEICEPLFERDSQLYYTSWTALNSNICLLYLQSGDFDKSNVFAYRVIEAFQNTPGYRTPDQFLAYAYFLNNLGQACTQTGEFGTADTTLHLAVQFCQLLEEQGYQKAVPLRALALNNLGLNLYNQAAPEEALPYFEQSLDIHLALADRNPLRFQPLLAIVTANLALSHFQLGQYEQAAAFFDQSLSYYESLCELNPQAFLLPRLNVMEEYLGLVQETGAPEQVIEVRLGILELAKSLEAISPDDFRAKAAQSAGELAWQYLLFGKNEEAIRYAGEGLAKDSGETWIYSVLAPAYLLSGDFAKARSIYSEWRNKPYSLDETQSFREVFLQDIETLKQAGIQHPDFDKIRKLLKK
jgi:tetratricopeptide (TPR) repeat protein